MTDQTVPPVNADDPVERTRRELGVALDAWPEYVPPPLASSGGQGGAGGPVGSSSGSAGPAWIKLDLKLAAEPPNDLGNANRLILRYGEDLLYVRDVGWHAFVETPSGVTPEEGESRRWDREQGDRWAYIFAHRTATAINREADALEAALVAQLVADEAEGLLGSRVAEIDANRAARQKSNDRRVAALRSWALQSGNQAKINGMLETAAHYLTRALEELDARPDLFAVANGVLELGANVPGGVRFRPALRSDLITRQARFQYDPNADAPEWRRFLASAQQEYEVQAFLQRQGGYTLTGHTHEQFVVLHYGVGSNGKSTFLETLEYGFGDYALRLPFASLLRDDRKRGAEATPDIARLPGRRLVVASEAEENVTLSSATIKTLTERDTVTARHLNQGFFDFIPQHKLSCMFNLKPNIPSVDDGTWRRLRLVWWSVRFIKEHERAEYPDAPPQDPALADKLRVELPGILNWLLDGWREWREKGLTPPESISSATAAYRAENDPVGEFIRTVIKKSPSQDGFVSGKDLYNAYTIWAELSGAPKKSNTAFGRAAKSRLRAETSGIVRYLGICICPEWWGHYGSTPTS
jgi:putative DNA primase/helicase